MPERVAKNTRFDRSIEMGINENSHIKIWKLLSFAFLREEEISDTFKEVKAIMSGNTNDLVKWVVNMR